MNNQLRVKAALFNLRAGNPQGADSEKFHARRYHLPFPKIAVNNVDCYVDCETLDFKNAFQLKQPVYQLHAKLTVEPHLLVHVISTGVILDLVISNLIVKKLNLFVRLKHVGLGP